MAAVGSARPRRDHRGGRVKGGYSSDGHRSAGSSASEGGTRRRRSGGMSRTLPELPCPGQEAFVEDTTASLNERLSDIGATFQLPPLADRTSNGCAMLVGDILAVLPTAPLPNAAVLLQAMGLVLTWCTDPLDEDTALRLLETLQGFAIHGDPDVSHASLVALNALLKHCLPKKRQAVQARVISMLPGNDGGVDGTLAAVFLGGGGVAAKTQAALAVTHLVELASHLMQQAAPPSGRAFMSYSEKLGCILHCLHTACIAALRAKDLQASNAQHVASLLHLLQSTVALTPYHKLPLTAQALAEFIPDLLELASGSEKGAVIAAMQVLCSAVGSKRPFQQMAASLLDATLALDRVCELARARHFVAFKHEAVRLWSAVARNYPWIVQPRLDSLLQLIRDLQEAPDQMSKLTALLFISATSDQSLPSVLQPSEEIPVIDFGCFGQSNLPPGADPSEVNAAGDLLRKPIGADTSTHSCVFADKQDVFLEVVQTLVLPLVSDPVAAVRGHAVLALGNIPPATLDALPAETSSRLFETVLSMCTDDNNTVRGAAAKVIGVWVGAACILQRRERVVEALLEMLRAEQQALHQKAAWALSCLSERLRGICTEEDQASLHNIVRGCMEVLDRLPNKVPWNVVRALGNSGLLYAGPLDSVLKALSQLFDDPNVKVRWNTAYAIAQIFRNTHLRADYDAHRSPTPEGAVALVTKLCTVLQHEANFKVRIQACWALSALKAFPQPSDTLPLALRSVLQALASCDNHVDFEQYKYRDVLTVSLKGLLLHILRFCLKLSLLEASAGNAESCEQREVSAALHSLRPTVRETLESMLPGDEPVGLLDPLQGIAGSPNLSGTDPEETPILPSQTAMFVHDTRWLPLKENIEGMLESLASIGPPARPAQQLTSPQVSVAETSTLEKTLQNFASLFQQGSGEGDVGPTQEA